MPAKPPIHKIRKQSESDSRLAELVLYVSLKCQDTPTFGSVLLNKILFYADFHHYLMNGSPITGTVYMKEKRGPVPRRLYPVRSKLEEKKHLAIQERLCGIYTQKRTIALREPDLSGFTASEIEAVNSVLASIGTDTATEISDKSHRHTVWKIAEIGRDIPYEAAFLSDEPLSDEESAHALALAKKHLWNVL